TFFQGHAGQAAGHNVYIVSIDDVRAQIDVASLDAVFDNGGNTGEGEGRLSDVVAGIGNDSPREVFLLFLGGVRSDDHAVAARFVGGLDDKFLDVRKH